ncbi:hypothetical protein [Rhodoferax sp.]|uniref:hypothetical protein n=1 Tax=Rhodoferax sp. TaxID=50421 RepID=UPI00277AEE12|nr:hypothetical protein [Rhodoferax sp.]
MSYIVVKTINGRAYRYLQTSYRVGKKVKTKSVYLGPVGGVLRRISTFIKANRTRGPIFDEEAMLRDVKAADAKYAAMKERFTKEVGLKVGPANPVPVEKPATSISYAPSVSSPAPAQQGEQSPSNTEAPETNSDSLS